MKVSRLKQAFKCYSDGELAQLGIKQQSVASAKARKKIPNSWLLRIDSKGGSTDFILKGGSYSKNGVEYVSREVEEALAENKRVLVAPISEADNKHTIFELEHLVAQYLVYLVATKKNLLPLDDYKYRLLKVFARKHVLPKSEKIMEEIIKEIEKEIDRKNQIPGEAQSKDT